MKKPISPAKTLALAYLSLILAALALLLSALPGTPTDSSVLSLLPNFDRQNQELEQEFLRRLDTQLIFLLHDPEPKRGAQATLKFKQQLDDSQLIHSTYTGPTAQDLRDYASFSLEYATSLIDEDTRIRLQEGQQSNFVLTQLYLPLGGAMGPELTQDPLLLVRARQLYELSHSRSKFKRDGELSYLEDQTQRYYLVYAQSRQEGFATANASQLGAFVDTTIAKLKQEYPELQILKRGTVFYNRYFAENAQHDLTYLGSCTLGGVILLLGFCFRSFIPLLLTLLSIGCALLLGTCAVLMCFGKMHLITMVMGLSIIGICTDYSIYYLTRRLLHGASESSQQSLIKLKTVLSHALLTTSAAYLLLLLPPFPGLRQLAVFCIFGLLGAYGAVLFWQPLLSAKLKPLPYALSFFSDFLKLWKRYAIPLTVLTALSGLGGLCYIHSDDDPQALQASPALLQQEDQRIASLLDQDNSQTFLLLAATDDERLGQSLNQVRAILQQAVAANYLQSYLLPNYNPLSEQEQDFSLVAQNLNQVKEKLKPLKLYPDDFSYSYKPLSLVDYLESPAGVLLDNLYLKTAEHACLLIPLQGLTQPEALRQLAAKLTELNPSVIDRRNDFKEVFHSYRLSLSYLLLLAMGILFCFHLYTEHKLITALRLMLPTLLAMLCALSVNALCGYSLTLFTLLSLFLVLGIGIDYVLIFKQGSELAAEALFAITICLLTTLLTLGVLIFSSTQVTASFGLTLSTGILVTYLMAPWTLKQKD